MFLSNICFGFLNSSAQLDSVKLNEPLLSRGSLVKLVKKTRKKIRKFKIFTKKEKNRENVD